MRLAAALVAKSAWRRLQIERRLARLQLIEVVMVFPEAGRSFWPGSGESAQAAQEPDRDWASKWLTKLLQICSQARENRTKKNLHHVIEISSGFHPS
jgi:hypothetical protein